MFERYSEVARRAIFFARYEASQMGSATIEIHHLLLGLMREEKELFRQQLSSPEAAFEEIRKEFEAAFPPQKGVASSVDLPLSADSKRVLTLAAAAADSLGHATIAPVHLVIGIMQIENSLAARALRDRGMTLDRLRANAGAFVSKPAAMRVAQHFVGPMGDPRFDLHRLIGELPDDRLHAAVQVLEALTKDTVELTVRTPQGKFTVSFEPPGAAAGG